MTSAVNGNPHLNYIEQHLIAEIGEQLKNETLERFEVEDSTGLDGFMSALYNITLWTKTATGSKQRLLIVKLMKGDVNFRETSKAYIQFANEIFIYAKVLPTYKQILQDAGVKHIKVEDWVPQSYVAKFGYIEGLGATPTERDSVLVLDHLKPLGYMLGPRIYLTRDHLLKMAKPLGQYHALTYAMRLRADPRLEKFKREIVPLPFYNNQDAEYDKTNLWRVLYRVAFDRFYDFVDRHIDGNTFDKQSPEDLRLIDNLRRMRAKYFEQPTRLLEHLRSSVELEEQDRRFAAILHGDYNRNNVLFRYKTAAAAEDRAASEVLDVKMIDFQELRYGTPAIDLSFYLYMNTDSDIRDAVWLDVIKCYHANMLTTLESVMKGGVSDADQLKEIDIKLELYNFEHFLAHFSKYAFYGAIICMHFRPWVHCSTEDCARLSYLFETDMHGKEFHKLSIEAGGDYANMKILEVIRHASRMGYMDNI